MKLPISHPKLSRLTLAAVLAAVSLPAAAYVGPGAGLSLLSALWALLAAVFAALSFILLWPIRRMLKRRKAQRLAAEGHAPTTSVPGATPSDADRGPPR